MDVPFIQIQALRAGTERPALSQKNVLSKLIRQMAGWVSSRRAIRRSGVELRAMDDRLLNDIGLRLEQLEGILQNPITLAHSRSPAPRQQRGRVSPASAIISRVEAG
jgi:uncharacterized protein YjiS (DUF1127 family)